MPNVANIGQNESPKLVTRTPIVGSDQLCDFRAFRLLKFGPKYAKFGQNENQRWSNAHQFGLINVLKFGPKYAQI